MISWLQYFFLPHVTAASLIHSCSACLCYSTCFFVISQPDFLLQPLDLCPPTYQCLAYISLSGYLLWLPCRIHPALLICFNLPSLWPPACCLGFFLSPVPSRCLLLLPARFCLPLSGARWTVLNFCLSCAFGSSQSWAVTSCLCQVSPTACFSQFKCHSWLC